MTPSLPFSFKASLFNKRLPFRACEQPIRRQNLFVRWLLNGVVETICSVLKIWWSLWGEIRLLSQHIAKNLLRALKRSVMRIIVLPVGRCRVLEKNESGLRFPRNKIWRFTECTTPYNRPSLSHIYESSKTVIFQLIHFASPLIFEMQSTAPKTTERSKIPLQTCYKPPNRYLAIYPVQVYSIT